jgi:hypothetical protein
VDLGSYLPEHVRPFTDLLKQFPANYEKWVHAGKLPVELYQGDVLEKTTLTAIDEEGQILTLDIPAMVISCSCDVQPKQGKFAVLAPVIDFDFYQKNSELQGESLESHIRDLRANKIANLFFLPSGQKLKDCIIDFQQQRRFPLNFFTKGWMLG